MTNTIYIHQPEKAFSFTRLPNFLFEAPTFQPLSNEAKVLYAFVLRRAELSRKNGWADEYGRVYLYYPICEVVALLRCGRQKAVNTLRELQYAGLVEIQKQGCGKPNRIILSLCINQLRFAKFKRVVQTVLYAPHFISTMVVCGMIRIFLSPSGGLLNLILGTSVDFLSESAAFRTIYVASGIWQEAGWGTIIYMACLAAVDNSLYEAAKIDGASMFQRILHIDIPELVPMIVLQLIMSAGNLMNVGFEKVLLLQTELNKATSDIIAVYVYEQGIINAKYSYSTAVGLFNTVVNIILLIVVNRIAKKAADVSFV